MAAFRLERSRRESAWRSRWRAAAHRQPPRPRPTGSATLLRRLEQAAAAGDRAAVLALGDPAISRPSFEDFATPLTSPRPTRLVVTRTRSRPARRGRSAPGRRSVLRARHRGTCLVPGGSTCRPGAAPADPWRIAAVSRLSIVTGLYRLSLNTATEYDIHDLVVRAPDLAIDMPVGRALRRRNARRSDGHRAARPRPHASSRPPDPPSAPRSASFRADDELAEDIDMAFLRFSPYEFESLFDKAALKPRRGGPRPICARRPASSTTSSAGRFRST